MTINSRALNGFSAPGWVIAAAALAAAVASADATSSRTAYASAFGDASVSVDCVGTHIVPARVNATAECGAYVESTTRYAGRVSGTAGAAGSAVVLRDVYAFASGDATCTGTALTASALGEATGSASASVALCKGHIVRPAASLATAFASQSVNSSLLLVTRRPTVNAFAGAPFSRGESSIKRSGQSFYRHDGYVLSATGHCVGSVLPDRVLVSSTIGSFAFGESDGSARPLIRYSAASIRYGQSEAVSAVPTATRPGSSYSAAGSIGSVAQTLSTSGDSFAEASATSYQARARVRFASSAEASASCEQIQANSRLRALASSYADAEAKAVIAEFAKQYFATSISYAASYGNPFAGITTQGVALGDATCIGVGSARYIKGGEAYAIAGSQGSALGLSNADRPAHPERTMTVQDEFRSMAPASEDRIMMVTV